MTKLRASAFDPSPYLLKKIILDHFTNHMPTRTAGGHSRGEIYVRCMVAGLLDAGFFHWYFFLQ
jgi:hypothetical protein